MTTGPAGTSAAAEAAQAQACTDGGLAAVLAGQDLTEASAHFRRCTACQREFLDRGGLLPRLAAR